MQSFQPCDDRPAMKRLGYVPALDGVRGLAILAVVGFHYFDFPNGGGDTGVDLFFVLSGFLITTLLLEEHADTGQVRLRAFYVRRARRLLPALALMLAAYLVGAVAQGRTHAALRAVAAGGFYTANIAQAYWPHLIGNEPLGPLWSLAEEEQFYLVWPALLIVLLAYGVWRRRSTGFLIGAAIALVCAERIWLLTQHASAQRIYASPESAADHLLAGVLLAFLVRRGVRLNAHPLLVALALELLLVSTVLGLVQAISGPVIDVAAMVLIAFALEEKSRIARILSWRPLVWIGLISYSLYLWHMVVLSWFGGSNRAVALVTAVAVAWLSYRFVETRFRRRRGAVATPATEEPSRPSLEPDRTLGPPVPQEG